MSDWTARLSNTLFGEIGVFAGYAAHGVVPIVRCVDRITADGVTIGQQAIAMDAVLRSQFAHKLLQNVSAAILDWYRRSASRVHAEAITQCVLSGANPLAC